MWITGDVDLPQEVVDAHSEGRLVLFVGAGASCDSPSDLPLFFGLTQQLAALAGTNYSGSPAPDEFLGTLPETFDVRGQAARIIGKLESRPNSTHEVLIGLATAVGRTRIVTTNFDSHLTTAGKNLGCANIRTWTGPALPLGDKFEGVVHLHGALGNPPEELVLVDKDFGEAYLTRGWATNFLIPMFREFTVLFVGYSHDDPIMKYLARGLPSNTSRFALVADSQADLPKWSNLGIQTIEYPVVENDHSALVAALSAWNSRVKMGRTHHENRMAEIVLAGPKMPPEERDYVVDRLKNRNGAQHFTTALDELDEELQRAWLEWMETVPAFQALFNGVETDEGAAVLGQWFGTRLLPQPTLAGAALQVLQRLGGRLTEGLFEDVAIGTARLLQNDRTAGVKWAAFISSSLEGHSRGKSIASHLNLAGYDERMHESILRSSLRPYVRLKKSWNFDGEEDNRGWPDFEIRWGGNLRILNGQTSVMESLGVEARNRVTAIFEDSLIAAYELQSAFSGEGGFDALSWGRSAIEDHEQNSNSGTLDSIVDYLRSFSESDQHEDGSLFERWWGLEYPLFRRLALHFLVLENSRSADCKIEIILKFSLLFQRETKHEVYQLLRKLLDNAGSATRARLLEAVLDESQMPEAIRQVAAHAAYSRFNLLTWLSESAPDWVEVKLALEKAQSENPDFEARTHPDLDHWSSVGVWGGRLPLEVADFLDRLKTDLAAVMGEVLGRDYSDREFDEPGWPDALRLIRMAVESSPAVGPGIWSYLGLEQDADDPRLDEVRVAIVDGWVAAGPSYAAEQHIGLLNDLVENEKAVSSLSNFLLDISRRKVDHNGTPEQDELRGLASRLWDAHAARFERTGDEDVVSSMPLFLNSWPGHLVEFWMTEIDRRWRGNRESWSGLRQDELAAVEACFTADLDVRLATLPALSGQLYFMYRADEEYALKRIMPLFQIEATSRIAWTSFLFNPRYDDKLLDSGFLEAVIRGWETLNQLSNDLFRNRFLDLVVSIVSFSGITPKNRTLLLSKSILTDEMRYATDFVDRVIDLLRSDSVNGDSLWRSWIREHLDMRFLGVYRTAMPLELSRWLDVVIYLDECVPDAMELLSGRTAEISESFATGDIRSEFIESFHAYLIPHFADRIAASNATNGRVRRRISKLVKRFVEVLGDEAAAELIAAETRLDGAE